MSKFVSERVTEREKQKYEVLDQRFYDEVSEVILQSRKRIFSSIDSELVMTNWKIGKMIDEKQRSLPKGEYGEKLVEELSFQMTRDFGVGYSRANLFFMRKFYKTFQTVYAVPRQLSWTHIKTVLTVENKEARDFYINECIKNNWSTRQLAREIHNISYERYILGNKNYAIIQETADRAREETNPLVIEEPLLFDFLGLKLGHEYYESDLETAIINHLQEFLLELGQGYTFVARQKRLDIGGKYFYIDLVLYNIFEKCYVLIDLKRGEVTHQDIGQMQMYVNYFSEELMIEGDKPPIGTILCADKNDKVIRYTLGANNQQVRAYKYIMDLTEGELIKNEAESCIKAIKEKAVISKVLPSKT